MKNIIKKYLNNIDKILKRFGTIFGVMIIIYLAFISLATGMFLYSLGFLHLLIIGKIITGVFQVTFFYLLINKIIKIK